MFTPKKIDILGTIHNHYRLKIPFFQRSYVWKKDLWQQYLESIEEISDKFKDKKNDEYFFGTIVLKFEKADADVLGATRTIIDGQQRLITTCLFWKVFSDITEINLDHYYHTNHETKTKSIILEPSCRDEKVFNKIMEYKEEKTISLLDNFNSEEKETNIYKCYKFLIESKDRLKKINANCFTKAFFVVIDIENSEADEQEIFDTINSLGEDLTTSDIIKNILFKRGDQDKHKEYWVKVFEKDKEIDDFWRCEIGTGRNKKQNIEWFFQAFFEICFTKSNKKREYYNQFRSFSRKYKEFFKEKDFKNNHNNLLGFLEDLKIYAEIYHKNFAEDGSKKETSFVMPINIFVHLLNTTSVICYALYVLKEQQQKEEQEKIFKLIATYIIRRMVCGSSTRAYSNFFATLVHQGILTEINLIEHIKKNNEQTTDNGVPSDSKFKENFYNNDIANISRRAILYLIEQFFFCVDIDATLLKPVKGYSVEHLLPRKWESNWPLKDNTAETLKERQNHVNRIGNLTIIASKLNPELSNSAWITKRDGKYKKSSSLTKNCKGLHSLEDYLSENEWNEDTIDRRTDDLFKQAKKIWYSPFEE